MLSESLGIKFDKFVKVDKRAVSQSKKLGKLSTLLITKRQDKFAVPKWTKFTNYTQVVEYFGLSTVSKFAKNYFNFQNRAGDFPDLLHVYTWAHDKEQRPALIGNNTPSLDDLKKVNGKFKLTIDSTTKEITLDLTSKNSHSDMATAFTTAIKNGNNAVNGFKDAEVKWNTDYRSFVITAGGGASSISTITTGSDTDISGLLGLSYSEGARTVLTYPKVDNLSNVLDEVTKRNDSYFFITFDAEFTNFDTDVKILGEWVDDSKNDHCAVYVTTNNAITTQYSFTEKLKNYNGLVIEYSPNLLATNGKSCGIFSSVDYSKPNGNISTAYINVPEFADYSIKEDHKYDIITKMSQNRSNAYFTSLSKSAGYTWYMPGNIMGKDTHYLNTYIAGNVIKTRLQEGFAEWLTHNKFPSVEDVKPLKVYCEVLMEEILSINLITRIQSLDNSERLQLANSFSTKIQNIETNLITNGFHVEVGAYDNVEQCVNLLLVYVANVPIREICIKLHELRG